MAVQIAFLESVTYFAGLSPGELEAVSRLIFERVVERGEVVVFEGEPAEALYFVASGAVKVFKVSAEGKEQILSIVRPGETLGEVAIFDGGPSPAGAQAMGPVVLYGIRRDALEAVLRDHPRVALNVVRALASRVRQYVSLVEDLSFRHVIGRVAKILVEQAGDGGSPAPRLTQQEMAAMAGTAREVVARSLRSLEEEGAIRLDRHRIVITNEGALKEMAGVSP